MKSIFSGEISMIFKYVLCVTKIVTVVEVKSKDDCNS